MKNCVGGFTLEDILVFICEHANTNTIDVLKIDIEGNEHRILKDYNFSVKPRLIQVEAHYDKMYPPYDLSTAINGICEIMKPQGYRKTLQKKSNFDIIDNQLTATTSELHFQLQEQ